MPKVTAPELWDALKAFRRWYNTYGAMPGLQGLISKTKLVQLERSAGIVNNDHRAIMARQRHVKQAGNG